MRNTDAHLSTRVLPAETLEALRQFDSCTISNAIETFGVRLRNEGFTLPGLNCVTGGSPRLLGFAATFRVRSAEPPMTGNLYFDRTDWWEAIERLPAPRIAVVQDLSSGAHAGSTIGEVHAAILKAFRCNGAITNGAVRDVPAIAEMQFPMFAGATAVSHAYSHIVSFGSPVEILGLEVRAGDLLCADVHGVVSIPMEIAADVPAMAAKIRERERRIVEFCQSPAFTAERLFEIVKSSD